MSKTVPTPVAAALGIVPTVVDGVKSLPGKAVQLPVLAVSTALTALEAARREYDDLAGRGERLVSRLRGEDLDGLEDWAEDLVADTPLARPYDAVEDAVEDAVSKVTELLDRAADKATSGRSANGKAPSEKAPSEEAPTEKASRDKDEPTPSETPSTPTPVETAATPDVVATVELVSNAVTAPEVTDHDELPLPDYDHMTLGSLRGRLRSLTVPELVQVRDYEKAHAHRLPVVTLLDNRIAKLATDAAASPSPGGGDVVAPAPESAPKVTPATAAKKPATPRKRTSTP